MPFPGGEPDGGGSMSTAVEAFSLAMLYAILTMIHLPLIDVLLLVQGAFTAMA